MNLAGLEAALVATVTARDAVNDSLLNSIQATAGIGANERIEAYRANISGAHLNALDHAFPVTREVLGERYWRQLLEQEIEAFSSTVADLHAYGEFVPELLHAAQQRRPELEDFPYLADLATLEWHVHRARFAQDDPAFDWKSFRALTADIQSQASLTPSRALTVFRSSYLVDVIWHAHQTTGAHAPEAGLPAACCIHRINRFDVTVTRLSAAQTNLLVAIGGETSLEALSQAEGLIEPEEIIRQLYDWIQQGWIVGFEVE